MYKFLFILFFLFSFIAKAQDWKPQNGSFQSDDHYTAFINANIYKDEGFIQKGTLLIRQDRIIEIGMDVIIPENSIVIDLDGKYIYPSFIEIYSDYGIVKQPNDKKTNTPQLESNKKGPYYWNESVKAEVTALSLFKYDDKNAKKYREMGFGVVSTHLNDGVIRGTSTLIDLNEEDKLEVIKENAAFYYSFQKGSSKQTYPSSLMGMIALIRQFNYDARWYKKNKEYIDYNSSLSAMIEAEELPKVFYATNTASELRAKKIAEEFNHEYILFGNGTEYERVMEIKETNSTIIAPVNFPLPYDVKDPYESIQLSLSKMKEWELAPYNLVFLQREEIPFLVTSEGIKSSTTFLENLSKANKAGVDHNSLVASLTSEVAKKLGVFDKIGSLDKGKRANFLITNDSLFVKKAKILNNWVAGSKFIISNETENSVIGTYHLKIEKEKEFRLVVESKGDKYSAKVALKGDKEFIPAQIERELQRIKLSFIHDSIDYRLSGTVSDSSSRIWSGKTLLNGNWISWAALKQVNRESVERDKKNESKENIKISPQPWYPNMAYGWDSLPNEALPILFRNATVWTNEEDGILKNHDVFIEGGRIRMVGYRINMAVMFPEFEKKAVEIDLKGKHLTSGIIDEHSHIAIERGVNESGQSITSEVRIGDVVRADDINIYRQLSGGVTAAQLLHGSANPIGGQSALIKLRWGKTGEEMKIKDADGFIKFALGENVKQSNWGDRNTVRFPQTRMGVEQVFYDGFTRAKEYADAQKIHQSKKKRDLKDSSGPRVDLELEALAEILDSQRFITCHSYIQSEINMLMHVADSMDFQINTFTHILEGYKVADKLKTHGSSASTFSDWWAYKFEVNDAIPYNGAILSEQGVNTGFNSDDAEMGRRLNQEAAKAIKYGGLSEEDAWKFVTLNPAKMLHLDDRMGSIREGKDADIVIWSDNPLSVYSKAEQTYIDGIKYFDINRNEELRERNTKERERLISSMLNSSNKKEKTQKIVSNDNKLYECDTLEP